MQYSLISFFVFLEDINNELMWMQKKKQNKKEQFLNKESTIVGWAAHITQAKSTVCLNLAK